MWRSIERVPVPTDPEALTYHARAIGHDPRTTAAQADSLAKDHGPFRTKIVTFDPPACAMKKDRPRRPAHATYEGHWWSRGGSNP